MEEALEREIARGPNWMYRWELGGDRPLALLNPELESIHATRLELIEEPVRAALERAGPDAVALDLACSEGWFSHRLLEWGAGQVVGIDVREENIRRARLVRDRLGVPADRLELRQGDIFALEPTALGTFDVVLLLGLIYHVEDPVGALRRARALTRGVYAIESQLTHEASPISYGWGISDTYEEAAASFALRAEADAEINPVASAGGVVSLIPNREAVELCVRVAGFPRWEWRAPASHHNRQSRAGDRAVGVAWPAPEP